MPPRPTENNPVNAMNVGFFGTSIIEHLEAFNAQMVNQANLPEIGSSVVVEEWRHRGWVQRLMLALQIMWPQVSFATKNRGRGGATSRDLVKIVEYDRSVHTGYDLVLVSCGLNDVWRKFQGRLAEAVEIEEYRDNIATIVQSLSSYSRRIIVLSETPFGPIDDPQTVRAMNQDLVRFNQEAARVAVDCGALFLDVWTPFTMTTQHLAATQSLNLWSDGVHLNELGDTLMLQEVEKFLRQHFIIETLVSP